MGNHQREGTGVQDLIERLREEGTEAGRHQAEQLKEQARQEAEQIVADARAQADRITREAKEQAEADRRAAREAINQAYRDTLLCVKESLNTEFRRHLQSVVGRELSDSGTLRSLIATVLSHAIPEEYRDRAVTLELPERVVSLDDLRQRPEEGEDPLSELAKDLTSGMLAEGVYLEQACDDFLGMRIRIEDEDVTIELTDDTIAEVLYRHLIPRFRAVLDGIVQ
jgi:V/A-type H+-transporting ATPase subunit E